MAKIGFIGMGNMGSACLKGVLRYYDPSEVVITRKNIEKAKEIAQKTGVHYAESNAECANGAKYIILAVKPQMYDAVLKNIANIVTEKNVIISLAPGISISDIGRRLGNESLRIVRAMPNTPALVGEGMTGICYDSELFNFEEKEDIDKIFKSFGKYEKVDESLMDAVVCASGSSPAYVYMFIEALADSVVKYGLPRDKAYSFVAQTVLGSAKMVLETGRHPGELKDQVCSPGGTTIAGVCALEEAGFRNAVINATDRCIEKCKKIK